MKQQYDACVIGSGMAGLTTACLLAQQGLKVAVLEQNYLPGGCTSSYWRKGFIFESGATTLVGLDQHMPLRHLLDRLGIQFTPTLLDLPMKVWMKNGRCIHKHQALEDWIEEAEKHFTPHNQRVFWKFCKKVSDFVWKTSIKQNSFPPTTFNDLVIALKRSSLEQVRMARYAFQSMKSLLEQFGLIHNNTFVDFVNEQLLITAQNHIDEVNVLFGAAALCYTNYGNYYVDGGLINLINPLITYLETHHGEVYLRTCIQQVTREGKTYTLHTKSGEQIQCKYLISGIPINNTLPLFSDNPSTPHRKKLLDSPQLNSAFQMGIGFLNRRQKEFDCLHHQIHLHEPLPEIGSKSIFLSLSHPNDKSRADAEGGMVASISTHVPNPQTSIVHHKGRLEHIIKQQLIALDFFEEEDIVYTHSSTPKSWQKWTMREWGFVGGYPQYMRIKPWQMIDARLDGKGAYICGDTTYPGQGIPGTVLSGVIAFEKLKRDHL